MEFRRVLFRSQAEDGIRDLYVTGVQTCALPIRLNSSHVEISYAVFCLTGVQTDRKSTRLNSSHVEISYAVFCLKKKNKIVEVGSGIKNPKKSDRVVVPFTISCGECLFCKKTLFSCCDRSIPIFFFNDTATPKFPPFPFPGSLPL